MHQLNQIILTLLNDSILYDIDIIILYLKSKYLLNNCERIHFTPLNAAHFNDNIGLLFSRSLKILLSQFS